MTCYKAHKAILEQESEQSKDTDLLELIEGLKLIATGLEIKNALNE